MENKNPTKQLKIELPESKAEGNYSNFTVISHSGAEFVIDFARIMPGTPKAVVQSRVIMTPIHAKTLLYTLKDNIRKFEEKFGEIKLPDQNSDIPFGFQPPPKSSLPN
ncbi:MAG: DUF3467 domain-containing protein [Candidatus Marinimicrobia bacterium]|nr:DUF3467 domain-containing protein [Candidatus Neomarinimicrobiota bacterium]RKY61461.1 MAG: DUF3467 domain-containing protein [Candidatus Neomarinimicrobiota bacterium]